MPIDYLDETDLPDAVPMRPFEVNLPYIPSGFGTPSPGVNLPFIPRGQPTPTPQSTPITPSPIPQELVEPPTLRLNIPETGEISPEHIAQFVGLAQNLHKQHRESQAAAIRYQGQLEYQQLINAGVSPDEAMRRTLPKIAYGHADTWTSTMQSTARLAEQERAKAQAERRDAERFAESKRRFDEAMKLKRTPEDIEQAERRRTDYQVWKSEHQKFLNQKTAAQIALNRFAQDAMNSAGLAKGDPNTLATKEQLDAVFNEANDFLSEHLKQGAKLGFVSRQHALSAQKREVGDIVTTAKGTFRWNGQGWEKATQEK